MRPYAMLCSKARSPKGEHTKGAQRSGAKKGSPRGAKPVSASATVELGAEAAEGLVPMTWQVTPLPPTHHPPPRPSRARGCTGASNPNQPTRVLAGWQMGGRRAGAR